MSRNDNSNGFYPQEMTINNSSNGLFDDEGMTDLSQTMNRKPTLNYIPQQIQNTSGYNSTNKPFIDVRNRQKVNSRKGKARRTLRQSLQKAYNNQPGAPLPLANMKFSNITLKKRKNGNIFSGERNINFDTAVKIDRNILPQGNLTAFNSPNGSFVIASSRGHSSDKNQGDNIFSLKRQIKDLRELLKEKDQQLMQQNLGLSLNTLNSNDDRDKLMQENQQLRKQLSLITDKSNEISPSNDSQVKRQNENLKSQIRKLEESRFRKPFISFLDLTLYVSVLSMNSVSTNIII